MAIPKTEVVHRGDDSLNMPPGHFAMEPMHFDGDFPRESGLAVSELAIAVSHYVTTGDDGPLRAANALENEAVELRTGLRDALHTHGYAENLERHERFERMAVRLAYLDGNVRSRTYPTPRAKIGPLMAIVRRRLVTEGNCVGSNKNFFSNTTADDSTIRRLCGGCAVKAECALFAIVAHEDKGYWGDLSENARKSVRRYLRMRKDGRAILEKASVARVMDPDIEWLKSQLNVFSELVPRTGGKPDATAKSTGHNPKLTAEQQQKIVSDKVVRQLFVDELDVYMESREITA